MTRETAPLIGVLALVVVAGCDAAPESGRIRASGYVEANEIRVAAEVGGRLLELNMHEGDRVATGDVVARLDTANVELALGRARAERDLAQAQLALLVAGSRPEDVQQAEATLGAREADRVTAQTELDAAETDLGRFDSLLRSRSGSEKQRDDAAARRDVARARVKASDEGVRGARQALARLRAGSRQEEVAAGLARVAAAEAQIAIISQALVDATIEAPADGVVTETLVEVGEIVAPRAPILIITALDQAWANIYVDEPLVPRLRLEQLATIFTDAGGAGLAGRVTFISPRAEFTPRNVQTANERSKLVYRLKVSTDNREGILKQGMPVEAELMLQPAAGG